MSKFLADENVNPRVARELRTRVPEADILSAADAGLRAASDPDVLAWAAAQGRVVVTHDLRTMVPDAWARVGRGQTMPGVVFIPNTTPIGVVLAALAVIIELGEDADFRDRVIFLD